MNELTIVGDKKLKVNGVTNFGNYNNMPEPHFEIDVKEFWAQFHTYSFNYMEQRQVLNFEDYTTMRTVELFWWNGGGQHRGLAVFVPMKWTAKNGKVEYLEESRYFKIGCVHKYKELGYNECVMRGITHHGRCWHVNECELCGTITAYDSSD